jgi:hypothetical protein
MSRGAEETAAVIVRWLDQRPERWNEDFSKLALQAHPRCLALQNARIGLHFWSRHSPPVARVCMTVRSNPAAAAAAPAAWRFGGDLHPQSSFRRRDRDALVRHRGRDRHSADRRYPAIGNCRWLRRHQLLANLSRPSGRLILWPFHSSGGFAIFGAGARETYLGGPRISGECPPTVSVTLLGARCRYSALHWASF